MKQSTESKSAVISIRVPVALFERIQRVTEAEGITVADWARAELLLAVRRAENGPGSEAAHKAWATRRRMQAKR